MPRAAATRPAAATPRAAPTPPPTIPAISASTYVIAGGSVDHPRPVYKFAMWQTTQTTQIPGPTIRRRYDTPLKEHCGREQSCFPRSRTGHPMVQSHRGLWRFLALSALAGQSVVGAAHAANVGWDLEKDVETPSYAVVEPSSTNINVDVVVLSCEQGLGGTGLQL